jgi:hypothetical protein
MGWFRDLLSRFSADEKERLAADYEATDRCRAASVLLARGDARGLRVAEIAVGAERLGGIVSLGLPEVRRLVQGKRELKEAARLRLASLLRDMCADCSQCGAPWWPPEQLLCKWCGELAEDPSRATANGRALPQRPVSRWEDSE